MLKRVIVPGLLGGVVLIVWTFIVNGILGFRSSVDMKQVADERRVYGVLRDSIVEPGRYIVNPELTASETFPGGEPVFSILYSGMGHESAGMLALLQLALFFLASIFAAWMLSVSSARVLNSYARKVLFFVAIGLLFGLYGDLMLLNIDGYPNKEALLIALNDVIAWSLVGLAVAWRTQPEPGMVTGT